MRDLTEALRSFRPSERISVGVVAYRDRGDAYVTRASPLSPDINSSYTFLATLTADGGGDTPEDVLSGVHAALYNLSWDEGPDSGPQRERQGLRESHGRSALRTAGCALRGHHRPAALRYRGRVALGLLLLATSGRRWSKPLPEKVVTRTPDVSARTPGRHMLLPRSCIRHPLHPAPLSRSCSRRGSCSGYAVLRGEKAPDDALARELGAMGLL
ncbi:hypothetical protein [Vitiosangium sp. GDMCC 1.1324]|uniref:hypothetical protein n=1 Tax=Vitiosangium sp. (strain GDMCC 1.1324) TaxID=2138576 RepID=UPI00130EFD8C|nr:hypothetical protein [Vitiosangium sp. GDMCC 1.1324]